jgi:hypothetical protein
MILDELLRALFWKPHCLMGCDQRTLPLLSSTAHERGDARFAKIWKIVFGFNKSTPNTDYHWNTSSNFTSFGKCLEPCTLTKTPRTLLLGSFPRMVATLQGLLTRCNFWGSILLSCLIWYGSLGHLPNTIFLLGWSFKIECGRRIDLSEEGDQIVGYARFVTKCKNRALIFYLNALHHSNLERLEELARSHHDIEPREWHIMRNVKQWWSEVIHKNG